MGTLEAEKIKVVAVDLDGTLLTDDKRISEATESSLRNLSKRGISVIIATGRSYEALKPFKEQLELDTPVICYNGAQVVDGRTEEILLDIRLPDSSSRFIIDYARKNDIHVHAYKEGGLYYERRRKESDYYESHVGVKGRVVNFDTMKPFGFTKMMYVGDHAHLERAAGVAVPAIGMNTSVIFSNTEFLEFIHKDVSKGNGLLYALDLMGYSPEEAVAFGDGDNDISLLEAAGIGVAMGNASPSVKAAADIIAPSNSEDGIAFVFSSFFREPE